MRHTTEGWQRPPTLYIKVRFFSLISVIYMYFLNKKFLIQKLGVHGEWDALKSKQNTRNNGTNKTKYIIIYHNYKTQYTNYIKSWFCWYNFIEWKLIELDIVKMTRPNIARCKLLGIGILLIKYQVGFV